MPSKPPVSNRAISEQVEELKTRVDGLNLNGSAKALIALAVASPVLLKLAEAAPRLIEVADKQADWDGFWRVVRRLLNPFKPAGSVFWLICGGLVTAYLVNRFNLT